VALALIQEDARGTAKYCSISLEYDFSWSSSGIFVGRSIRYKFLKNLFLKHRDAESTELINRCILKDGFEWLDEG
jgi:hypothetical protein